MREKAGRELYGMGGEYSPVRRTAGGKKEKKERQRAKQGPTPTTGARGERTNLLFPPNPPPGKRTQNGKPVKVSRRPEGIA